MDNDNRPGSFWTTVPGILTGTAALLSAVGGLIGVLFAAWIFESGTQPQPTPVPTVALPAAVTPTTMPTLAQPETATPSPDPTVAQPGTPTPSHAPSGRSTQVPQLTIETTPVSTETSAPPQTPTPVTARLAPTSAPRDDHGDFPNLATSISVPGTVSGKLEPSTDVDYFSFGAEERVKFAFETREGVNRFSGLGVSMVLLDEDGVTELESWSRSRQTWTAPRSGTYYIRASDPTTDPPTYTLAVFQSAS